MADKDLALHYSGDPETDLLHAEIDRLRAENRSLRDWQQKSIHYIRDKVDQLLGVVGTSPLRPEELDDDMLIGLDPIGIVSDTFVQILENLRLTNEELSMAKNELAAIFHAAGNGIMVLNAAGEVVSYNSKLKELFLRDGDQLTGLFCYEKICTSESRHEACVFNMVMQQGRTVTRRDWQSRGHHYDVIGAPIKNRNGEIIQVVQVYNDITDRKRNEQALAEANVRLDTIFDSVLSGILLIDAETQRIVDANRKAVEMIDAPLERILGSECFEFLCPGWHEGCPILDKGMTSASGECEVLRLDGLKIPILKTVVSVFLDGRRYLLESFIDITDRKKAEESVRVALAAAEDARAKMDGILQSVADPLIVTDPVHRIIMMNRAAEDLLGICLFESLGLPLEDVLEDQRLLRDLQSSMALENHGSRVDFLLPSPDGGKWIFQGRTSALCDLEGRVTGMITIMQNVTRDREIDRMKSDFVSTAAHELQTPLSAIIGFSELLLSQKGLLSPDVEHESLTYIFDKADLLSKIVDDLLDISRIESGRPLEIFVDPFNLNTLVEQVVKPYRTRQGPHMFEVFFPEEPVEIIADKRKIEQILDNILSNAFKYSPRGGMIRLAICCNGVSCEVSVEDQGIGMTAEQKRRVFDKFYRGDSSNTSIGGTGLGMSITKHFVEAHGGRIWVNSEPGQGTKVSFEIPVRPRNVAAGPFLYAGLFADD